jgi:hypothetical protein
MSTRKPAPSAKMRRNAQFREHISRPLGVAIQTLKKLVAQVNSKKRPDFDGAYDICDFARSVFFAYVLEWTLNRAVKYREAVVPVIADAQSALERCLRMAESTQSPDVHFIRSYVEHNQLRVELIGILHEYGEKAMLERLSEQKTENTSENDRP